jgi:hypothetical protein
MLRRTALVLALPLSLALGFGVAPPPPQSPGVGPASSTAPAPAVKADTGGRAADKDVPGAPPPAQLVNAPPPPPPPPAEAKPSASTSTVSRAAATDAPIVTTITQDDILALVNKNADAFYRCQSLGAGASKSWRAIVTIKATVSPLGAVNAIEVVSSTTKNPRVDACVIDSFRKLTFARPAGSGATVFTFPMKFDPMQQVQ